MEDTKLLVAGAASSQDKLAQAAHSSAKTITQLTEVVKLGATSMGSEGPETQVSQAMTRHGCCRLLYNAATQLVLLSGLDSRETLSPFWKRLHILHIVPTNPDDLLSYKSSILPFYACPSTPILDLKSGHSVRPLFPLVFTSRAHVEV